MAAVSVEVAVVAGLVEEDRFPAGLGASLAAHAPSPAERMGQADHSPGPQVTMPTVAAILPAELIQAEATPEEACTRTGAVTTEAVLITAVAAITAADMDTGLASALMSASMATPAITATTIRITAIPT